MFKLINTRKLLGLLMGFAGVLMVRANPFGADTSLSLYVTMIGVMIACAGIAVFAAGIKNKIEKKIRVCSHCYKKNDAENERCSSCKKKLETPKEK